MKNKVFLSSLVAVAVSSAAFGVFAGPGNGKGSNSASKAVSVVTETVQIHQINQSLDLIGKLESAQSVTVASEVSGVVASIHVAASEAVKEGQLLITLDDAKTKASVAEAQAYLADEKRKLAEFERLVKRSAIAQTEVDAQKNSVEIAKARYDAAVANLADHHIKAPFSGTVGFVDFSRGQLVSTGAELVSLDDLSLMQLDLSVPERYLSQLNVGMSVKAIASAWGDEHFVGEVTAIDTRINPETLNLRVRIEFANDEGKLKPGMLLDAHLAFAPIEAPIIPVQALEYSGTKRFVYVVDKENKAHRTEVVLGARVENQVVITEGLTIGETIVVQGIVNMRDGVEVSPMSLATVQGAAGETGEKKASKKESN
ncbi:efflux RND transporter periplasmic adaptor subunit [Vibrio sp. SM6]|uniref:Efflux RND transporter periplasmic adaptor subunit n=1 Tax=Vibrio agarilyticus TaxID=2726741 RepID=A0A7X8TSK3_9VIBR|nr:efflux RND transporter periplasmic adaptor subunit [Vibrio agarilyticus]NLS13861.1 efflux RND transporter periplasmic adaptor subunit [Vibrio agarilyticus]